MAPVVPQDAHFTLNFAHPTVDATGAFENATLWSDNAFPKDADVETPAAPPPPNQVGRDDMSDINPNPPSVPFLIRHTLTEVDLYQYTANPGHPWTLVYSATAPANPNPGIGVTQLSGTWLTGDPSKRNPRQLMTQLKIIPWRLLTGESWTAQWNSQSQPQVYGTSFTDQGLQFDLAGLEPPTIANLGSSGSVSGLMFAGDGSPTSSVVTIRFAQPSILTSITGLIYVRDGEFSSIDAPQCSSDGAALTPVSSSQDKTTQVWTLTYPSNGTAIQQLTIPVAGNVMLLYAIDYSTAPVPMAILPAAPALYALKIVTKIEAERVGTSGFQTVLNGSPIVEFTYFQTAAGPGTAVGSPAPTIAPVPSGPAPYLQLAANCSTAQQPTSAFPIAGAITDLHTYTQWSWPPDGATAAYYGYDVNVEFVESYVNALYTAFASVSVDETSSSGLIYGSLHFRCVDRNNNHTLLLPNAIHVPSIPQQSALAAGSVSIPLPEVLQVDPISPAVIAAVQQVPLQQRASQAVNAGVYTEAASVWTQPSLSTLLKNVNLNARTSSLGSQQISPILAGAILHQIAEYNAAQQARTLWFKPLLPATRYTLDVVAGPLLAYRGPREDTVGGNAPGSLYAILTATDAIGMLAALQAYYAHEDSLTTLERVQFTTSGYETFTAHLANAARQLAAAPGATPIRNYVAAADPITWLASATIEINAYIIAGTQYLTDHNNLAALVGGFDPLADDLEPGITPAANGAAALVKLRQTTAADWAAFARSVNALYDGLITALGHPEMASGTTPIAVPDTEINLFTDSSGLWVNAILIQSREPLPWQRIWRWIRLTGVANTISPSLALWNADGTVGLIVPFVKVRGALSLSITFQGNIGAEAPCITKNGGSITETVPVGAITMGPSFHRVPGTATAQRDHPAPDLAPILQSILHM